MALEKLKAIKQDTWLHAGGGPSKGGVCYYMCNFVESDKGIWNNPGSYANAVEAGRNFAQGTAMMNYAKAQNLRKAPQSRYAHEDGALAANRIYRVELWIGDSGEHAGDANHEVLALTGADNSIVYFEPNFGFYQAAAEGMNNREALEYYVNEQYGEGTSVGSFGYKNVRANSSPLPKGFDV